MISRQWFVGFPLCVLLGGFLGCESPTAPNPAKLDQTRCRVTAVTFDSQEPNENTVTLKAGSLVEMIGSGETVGIHRFPGKRGTIMPPTGSPLASKMKLLSMMMVASFFKAAGNDDEVFVSTFDVHPECIDRKLSWNQTFEVPKRRGSYELRLHCYWLQDVDVDPGVHFTPDSHVIAAWKIVVE